MLLCATHPHGLQVHKQKSHPFLFHERKHIGLKVSENDSTVGATPELSSYPKEETVYSF